MSADIVQLNREEMRAVAAKFDECGDDIHEQLRRISDQMEVLRSDAWISPAADAFYSDMDSEVLPALQRLHAALLEASDTCDRIVQTMDAAEQDASSVFPM